MSWLTSTAWQLMRRFSEASLRVLQVGASRSRKAVPFPVVIVVPPVSWARRTVPLHAASGLLLAGLADERFGVFVGQGQHRRGGRRRCRHHPDIAGRRAVTLRVPPSGRLALAEDGDIS